MSVYRSGLSKVWLKVKNQSRRQPHALLVNILNRSLSTGQKKVTAVGSWVAARRQEFADNPASDRLLGRRCPVTNVFRNKGNRSTRRRIRKRALNAGRLQWTAMTLTQLSHGALF